MTPLQQTALDFCRECLGWDECREYYGESVQRMTGEQFRFTDLNAVLEAVRLWCKERGCKWGVVGNSQHGQSEYLAYVLPHDDFWEGRGESEDPCYSLLSACVAANRRLAGSPMGEPPTS